MFIEERIPIPAISDREQRAFVRHVDGILLAKDRCYVTGCRSIWHSYQPGGSSAPMPMIH